MVYIGEQEVGMFRGYEAEKVGDETYLIKRCDLIKIANGGIPDRVFIVSRWGARGDIDAREIALKEKRRAAARARLGVN